MPAEESEGGRYWMQGEARRPPDSLQTGETFAKKGKHVQEEET